MDQLQTLEGKIEPIELEDEMRSSFIDYAMSVIVDRALPDVRDGLKPSQRRILVAMNDLGLGPTKQHRKCAKIAGDTSGNYHPHGEAVIYPTLVRMAQDFNMRYPLVDGQGNFGSVEGDPPAAMRYTEARLSRIATEMLRDIDANTVDWVPNYDETRREPTVLPSRMPNLMVNGSNGIAVGMATNIPPHNLGETVDAIAHLIDHPDADADELMQFIKGPDFPTGGLILGTAGIKEAYRTGRGRIRVRAMAHTEQLKGNRTAIVVTELPYQVNRSALIEDIVELVKQKKISEISDLRNESDRNGMRVVIELKREAIAKVVLNKLYKHTQMQTTFGVINIALVGGVPRTLTLPEMLRPTSPSRRKSSSGAPSSSSTRPRRGRTSSRACWWRWTTSTRSSPSSARRQTWTRRETPSWTPSSSRGRRRRPSWTCASSASPSSSAPRCTKSTRVCWCSSRSCASCSATSTPSTSSSRRSC